MQAADSLKQTGRAINTVDVVMVHAALQAFDSPGFPYLASLGVGELLAGTPWS